MTDEFDEDNEDGTSYGEQDFIDMQQDIGFKRGFELGVKLMMRATGTQHDYANYYKRVRKWRYEPWIGAEGSTNPPTPWGEDGEGA
jgi:hypothetical protein